MQELCLDTCTCRNNLGERTRLGQYFMKMMIFRQENPGKNIVEFFDKEKIEKMCCRMHLASLYHIRLESSMNDKDIFVVEPNSRYSQDLTPIRVTVNEEIDWP